MTAINSIIHHDIDNAHFQIPQTNNPPKDYKISRRKKIKCNI